MQGHEGGSPSYYREVCAFAARIKLAYAAAK